MTVGDATPGQWNQRRLRSAPKVGRDAHLQAVSLTPNIWRQVEGIWPEKLVSRAHQLEAFPPYATLISEEAYPLAKRF